ncbi:hypothetical protein KDA_39310 [Dictyobacter alpinus]|uniref:Nitroreductase n=1 Tax=Dictyobacter alpinus TaxID=2014873 RepID=A0A402BAZ1_9CHLR|nr:nitroreductase/quinone reductase family protein [Dictyobacter alpinus]GCE28447.1 hypothetical protein KDA_39310 [Dictyobacter alpinus]
MGVNIQRFAEDDFCYLSTVGRQSGRVHTIEIWFAAQDETLYLLSGGRDKSDWVKNIQQQSEVQIKLGDEHYQGEAHIIEADSAEDTLARQLVADKYVPRSSDDLTEWSRDSLPIAIVIRNRIQ